MQSFRVWYADGVADGKTAEDWGALPADGVQVVHITLGEDEHGRRLGGWFMGADFYWHDGQSIGAGTKAPKGASVKRGARMEAAAYEALQAKAREWADG